MLNIRACYGPCRVLHTGFKIKQHTDYRQHSLRTWISYIVRMIEVPSTDLVTIHVTDMVTYIVQILAVALYGSCQYTLRTWTLTWYGYWLSHCTDLINNLSTDMHLVHGTDHD